MPPKKSLTDTQRAKFTKALEDSGRVIIAAREAKISERIGYQIVKDDDLHHLIQNPRISDESRALFLKTWKETKNIAAASKKAGIGKTTGVYIAIEHGHKPRAYDAKGKILPLFRKITDVNQTKKISDILRIRPLRFKEICTAPERLGLRSLQNIIQSLRREFPDKGDDITQLESLLCPPEITAAELKKTSQKEAGIVYRQQVGTNLKEWRMAIGLSFKDAQKLITARVVQDNLDRIERCDLELDVSVYKRAHQTVPFRYTKLAPDIALVYLLKMKSIKAPK